MTLQKNRKGFEMTKRFEIKFYNATATKGERVRVLGLSNKYVPYHYKYDNAIEQGLNLLSLCGYSEEQINRVIPTKTGAIVIAERW